MPSKLGTLLLSCKSPSRISIPVLQRWLDTLVVAAAVAMEAAVVTVVAAAAAAEVVASLRPTLHLSDETAGKCTSCALTRRRPALEAICVILILPHLFAARYHNRPLHCLYRLERGVKGGMTER